MLACPAAHNPSSQLVHTQPPLLPTISHIVPFDTMKTLQNFVFGYGSLICSHSRAITSPEQSSKVAMPVIVRGLERVWSKRTNRGMTAMGVRFADGETCNGVLLPVSADELKLFDQREMGYDRHLVSLENVDLFEAVREEAKADPELEKRLLEAKATSSDNVKVWVYVQREHKPPTPEHPIVQTYVDTILRGCLSVSHEFAQQFIEDTKGWDPAELAASSESDSEDEEDDDQESIWVDDREDPIYIRGDPAYSRQNSLKLDRLLKKHRPEEFQNRAPLEREDSVDCDS